MKKQSVIDEINKNFEEDLKKSLEPLHDIEQSVHETTVKDLKELFEAVGSFAYDEAINEVEDMIILTNPKSYSVPESAKLLLKNLRKSIRTLKIADKTGGEE